MDVTTSGTTSTASGPPPAGADARTGHRADIQGLRAVAVLLVVCFHADISAVSGGYIGVDVFFVVSGFVITQLLVRERQSTGRVSLRSFYLRRARRILPALAVLLVPVMVLAIPFGSIGAQARTLGTGAAAALFSANVYLVTLGKGGYFNAAADTNPLLHTWSLSLEEQFYFFFPAVVAVASAFAARRRTRRTVVLALVISAISLASFVLCWAATTGRLPSSYLQDEFAFFMAPSRAWQFGAGALLAVLAHRWTRNHAVAEVCGWLGLALIAWSAVTYTEATLFPGLAAAVPTVGAALALAAGIHHQPSATRMLSVRPLGWIGDRSYSWYLWHWPLIVFAGSLWPSAGPALLLAAAIISLVPAVASFEWVEQPIRHRRPVASSTARLTALCILVPVATAIALVPISNAVTRSSTIVAFDEQVGLHADAESGCFSGRAVLPNPGCRWEAPDGPASSSGRMGNVLLGDSNAGQFSEAFIEASHQQGRDATIQTKGVCPFVDLVIVNDHKVDEGCRTYVAAMRKELLRERPDAVVISNASDSYIERDAFQLIEPDGTEATTPATRAAAWTRGVSSIVDELQAADIDVVVVQPVPKFPDWDPHECAAVRILVDESTCGTSDGLADLERARARAVEAQLEVADAVDVPVSVVDPFEVLCSEDPCPTHRDGTWFWRDGNHVSVAGALAVTPLFVDALDASAS